MVLTHAMERDDDGFPPYNIEKLGDDLNLIVMAVAGLGANDLEVMVEQNRLTIRRKAKHRDEKSLLYRGITCRAVVSRFTLAEFIEVVGASQSDGLPIIDLKHEPPNEPKPQMIDV